MKDGKMALETVIVVVIFWLENVVVDKESAKVPFIPEMFVGKKQEVVVIGTEVEPRVAQVADS